MPTPLQGAGWRGFGLAVPGERLRLNVEAPLAGASPALWGDVLEPWAEPEVEVRPALSSPPDATDLHYFDGHRRFQARNFGVDAGGPGPIQVRVTATPMVMAQAVRVGLEASLQARGWWSLHASAVQTDAGVVAFSAPSGTGKSTLAARCDRLGFRRISDESTLIRETPAGFVVSAHPSQMVGAACGEAFPLLALARLVQGEPGHSRLHGAPVVFAVLQSLVCHDDAAEVGARGLALASSIAVRVPVLTLRVPNDDSAFRAVQRLVQDLPGVAS